MPYVPTVWVDGTTAITATQLNRIETGVDDAHDALAKIHVAGVAGTFGGEDITPAGWTIAETSPGSTIWNITHSFAHTNYAVSVIAIGPQHIAFVTVFGTNNIQVQCRDSAGTAVNVGFSVLVTEVI